MARCPAGDGPGLVWPESRGLIADLRGLYGQFIALPAATATASAGAAIGSRLQEAAVKELVTDEHAMVKGDLSFFWGNVNIL